MNRLSFIAFFIAVSASLYSCNQNKESNKKTADKIDPAEVVQNPATASGNTSTLAGPAFKFAEETHDFGKIVEGEKVSYSFKFTNSGNANLIISSASGSCGCTVPEWPKEPIAPGKDAVINVIFNSEGKSGKQNKTVTLVANTVPNTKVLTITGEVEAVTKK